MTTRRLPLFFLLALPLACSDDGGDDGEPPATGSTSSATDDSDSTADTTTSETTTDDSADGTGDSGSSSGGEVSGIPVLGDGTHDIGNVDVVVISTPDDGLNFPTDIEFNPAAPTQMWVTNREDFSIVIYEEPGLPTQASSKRQAEFDNGPHFLAKPAALAFGDNGAFATAQQENAVTQPGDPADGSFMGPTLWTGDIDLFNGGHTSHLDMLHNSPLSSGIAWESENTYWVFDGDHGSLTRYKFNEDHGLGGTDHTDGEIYRYANNELGYEPSIPSHVVIDHAEGYVYAADSANGRIVRLDPSTATMANSIVPNYDGCTMNFMNDAELITLVDGASLEAEMVTPSGLELVDDILFVTDPITGRVFGFDLDGNLLDWLDTGYDPGSVMGMAFDEQGDMWITDAAANQIRRFSVPR